MSKSRTIQKTSKFKKDFKQYQTNKKVVSRLNDILYCLMNRLPLSEQYKNRPLTGEWKGYYDCHVLSNVVLIYTYDDTTVSLTRIGTHNKLGLTESIQSDLKLHINESIKKYPPCPIKAKKNSYRSKTITKICDDGLELTFEVLPNRTTAIEFIYYTLYNYDFPWAQYDTKLGYYKEDEDWYIQDMERYENGESIDRDASTYIEFEDMSHIWIEEEPLIKNAIKAYRSAYKVEELLQETGYDATIYGGYIYYDEYNGDWRADLGNPLIDNFDERKWKVIGKTWVEER